LEKLLKSNSSAKSTAVIVLQHSVTPCNTGLPIQYYICSYQIASGKLPGVLSVDISWWRERTTYLSNGRKGGLLCFLQEPIQ